MDEQKVDPHRTRSRSGEDAEGNLMQANAPSVPLVGSHEWPSSGAGTTGAGPMQDATGGWDESGASGPARQSDDVASSSAGDDPASVLDGAETILGGIGGPGADSDDISGTDVDGTDVDGTDLGGTEVNGTDMNGADIGGDGPDGLLGGMGADADVPSLGGPSGARNGDAPADHAGADGTASPADDPIAGGDPEGRGIGANSPLSDILPDEDIENGIERDRQTRQPAR